MASASSAISRTAGAKRTGSSPCATRKSRNRARLDEPEQYQLFDTPEYSYRVFVTNMKDCDRAAGVVLQQRAGAENLIKEANNDAGLAAHPSARWAMNCIHFQLAMLAYNLNCWLMLFNREEEAKSERARPHHTRHNPAEVSVSGGAGSGGTRAAWESATAIITRNKVFIQRLMNRLRAIAAAEHGFAPVIAVALRC